MNSINSNRSNANYNPKTRTDAERLADLDHVIRNAARGDSGAVGIVATFLRSILVEEATLAGAGNDAEDVVHDLFVSMLEGETRFAPEKGRGVEWLLGIVRAMARRARGDEGEP